MLQRSPIIDSLQPLPSTHPSSHHSSFSHETSSVGARSDRTRNAQGRWRCRAVTRIAWMGGASPVHVTEQTSVQLTLISTLRIAVAAAQFDRERSTIAWSNELHAIANALALGVRVQRNSESNIRTEC